jgi:hypothetical protein
VPLASSRRVIEYMRSRMVVGRSTRLGRCDLPPRCPYDS